MTRETGPRADPDVTARIREADWAAIAADLDETGSAVSPTPWLIPEECAALRAGFDDDGRYRSTVDMRRFRFGEGVYRYFRYPLPPVVAAVREAAYPPLARLAGAWADRLGRADRPPTRLADLLARCAAAGQDRPTPLILRYGPGGYNCLHQDLYGEVAFPLQVTVALSRPGVDFAGGEQLFVEQRPRAQSRGTARTVPQGHAVVFPTRDRPVSRARGDHAVVVRHGVSTVTSGERFALGVIFHDAR
jgi:hypothetical protein